MKWNRLKHGLSFSELVQTAVIVLLWSKLITQSLDLLFLCITGKVTLADCSNTGIRMQWMGYGNCSDILYRR